MSFNYLNRLGKMTGGCPYSFHGSRFQEHKGLTTDVYMIKIRLWPRAVSSKIKVSLSVKRSKLRFSIPFYFNRIIF